jgi:hypothetical protein
VIADPSQMEDGRVWTRARDILPGRTVDPTRLVHAAFGDLSFRALPVWDGAELEWLWLIPHGTISGRPCPDRRRVCEAVGSACTGGAEAEELAGLVEDLMSTVEVLASAVEAHRRTAQELVRNLHRVDRRTVRLLGGQDLIDQLHRQARRPCPEPL